MGEHFARGHLDRARHLYDVNRYDLAEKELRAALALEPELMEAHRFLALCLLMVRRLDEALEEVKEAIRLEPEDAHAHYVMSRICAADGAMVAAEKAARESVRLSPDHAEYLGNLAFYTHQRGQHREALQLANEGLALDPNNICCLHARASALGCQGRYREAQQTIDQALVQNPQLDVLFSTLGWLMLLQQRTGEAIAFYQESLRLDPNDAEIQEKVAKIIRERLTLLSLCGGIAGILVGTGLLAVLAGPFNMDTRPGLLILPVFAIPGLFLLMLQALPPGNLIRLSPIARVFSRETAALLRSLIGPVLSALACVASFRCDFPALAYLGGAGFLCPVWWAMTCPASRRSTLGAGLDPFAVFVAAIGIVGAVLVSGRFMPECGLVYLSLFVVGSAYVRVLGLALGSISRKG